MEGVAQGPWIAEQAEESPGEVLRMGHHPER